MVRWIVSGRRGGAENLSSSDEEMNTQPPF
jgi:hypothetical protein